MSSDAVPYQLTPAPLDATTLPTLRALHAAIIAALRDHFGARVATIAAYDPFAGQPDADQTRQPLLTPALLLQLEAIDPAPDDGTDRQPLLLTWVIHALLSCRTLDIQVELRDFAAAVLNQVRHAVWDYPNAVRAPQALSAQPGEFVPGLSGYDSWQVRWEQAVYLGADVWAGGVPPTEVWFGIAPLIGDMDGTAADYFPIAAEDLPT